MDLSEIDVPRIADLLEQLAEKLLGWLQSFVVMLPNILIATLVVVLAWFASKWVANIIERLLYRATRNRPITNLMGTVGRTAVVLAGVFFALGLLNLDKTVTSLVAGVGVVGLALGFAFQDIAANFMSGLIMALNRPFKTDDQVEVAGRIGRVKNIALRATSIETLDGLSLLVPNKDIFQSPIINHTRTPKRRLEIAVGTAYCDDMETVEGVVREAVQELEYRDSEREIEVLFEEFAGSSINLSVLIWLTKSDQMTYRKSRSQGMKAIKKALDSAGITIPFPIRTLDFGADGVGGRSLRLDPSDPAKAPDEAIQL